MSDFALVFNVLRKQNRAGSEDDEFRTMQRMMFTRCYSGKSGIYVREGGGKEAESEEDEFKQIRNKLGFQGAVHVKGCRYARERKK